MCLYSVESSVTSVDSKLHLHQSAGRSIGVSHGNQIKLPSLLHKFSQLIKLQLVKQSELNKDFLTQKSKHRNLLGKISKSQV